MQRCSCGCYWPARGNCRCDLDVGAANGCARVAVSTLRLGQRFLRCSFGGGRPWVVPSAYQDPGGGHGRLYASARSLPLANNHALRPLDGEDPVVRATPGVCFVWIGSTAPLSLTCDYEEPKLAGNLKWVCLAIANWTRPLSRRWAPATGRTPRAADSEGTV